MKRKILFLKVLICLPNFQLYEKKKATHKKNFAFPPRKKNGALDPLLLCSGQKRKSRLWVNLKNCQFFQNVSVFVARKVVLLDLGGEMSPPPTGSVILILQFLLINVPLLMYVFVLYSCY